MDDELLYMEGFDDCIAGICRRCNQEDIVIYDYDKVIEKLMSQGMHRTEAVEFFEFNQLGAWMGDRTPAFIEYTS